MISIRINKNENTPVYRQIARQITAHIQNGVVLPGHSLPSERELASQLGVARGTVTKAYDELARNHVIEFSPGRSGVVSGRQADLQTNRKEQALRIIDELVAHLKRLRFSYREIRTLIDLAILEKENQFEQLNIAAIDCNPESLSIFQRQLGFISQMALTKFLLADLLHNSAPERKLAAFDLVLCTATHFSELSDRIPALRSKLVQVIVSPSQQSIIDLAGIGMNQRIGVICESKQFLNIIVCHLKDFAIPTERVNHLAPGQDEKLPDFLKANQVIITPPGYSLPITKHNAAVIQAFTQAGGKIIPFDYQIERSSLLYIEERIKDLLMRR